MNDLHRLKDMLTDELEEYGRKGELSAGTLEIVDKLSHALKSVTTIIAMEDSGYSGTYRGGSYERRRDRMGRYYDDAMGDMMNKLHDLMNSAPDADTKKEIQHLINKLSER